MATKMKSNAEPVGTPGVSLEIAQAKARIQADKEARAKAFQAGLEALCKEYRCKVVPMIQFVDGELRQAGNQVLVDD